MWCRPCAVAVWRWPLGLALVLCAAPGLVVADWLTERGDAPLRGWAPRPLAEAPALLWSVPIADSLRGTPVVAGDRIVGAGDATLRCLALDTGKVVWQAHTAGAIEGAALIAGESVYAGTLDGAVQAFSLATGAALWTFRSEGKIAGGANLLTVADGSHRLVFGSYDMKLYCLDPRTGALAWSFETSNYVNATPAIDGSRIVFGGCDGLVHVVSAADGRTGSSRRVAGIPGGVEDGWRTRH